MRWKLIAHITLGALVGAVTGPLHPAEWNRPVHYTEIVSMFVIFPAVFLALAVSERARGKMVCIGFAMILSYLIAWQTMHFLIHGSLFDDMVLMWPLISGAYIGGALVTSVLARKLEIRKNKTMN